MTSVQYDFAVLGDNQPEGLLVASGLVRKGYSVVLIPSTSLGEMPSDDLIPSIYPSQAGGRRVDDLLFRAGFFRLEDSGLSVQAQQSQMILPRHRLSFDGSWERYVSELKREFPLVADRFLFLCDQAKVKIITLSKLKKLSTQILELTRKSPEFGRWLFRTLYTELRPSSKMMGMQNLIRRYLQEVVGAQGKVYRVDPKMKLPYSAFLTEHARKWGVQVLTEAFELKPSFSSFEIANGCRTRCLILNSVGARRAYMKALKRPQPEKLTHWLFIDRVECSLGVLPEPLEENSVIDLGSQFGPENPECLLHLKRDLLRDEAILSLGTWLNFEDSKDWLSQIEQSRKVLQQLLPFLPPESFRKLPTLLELMEMRGESIRRGQVERLMAEPAPSSQWRNLMRWISRTPRPHQIARRVYSLNPLDLAFRNRRSSFDVAMKLLDYFDERRSRLRANAMF